MSLVTDSLVATGAMTASQHIEMAVTGRGPSSVPVDVVERIVPVEIPGALRPVVGHVAQSSLAVGAVVGARVLRAGSAIKTTGLLTAGLVIGDAVLAAAVGVGGPPWKWTAKGLATDALHKGVLSAAAVALSRR